MGKTKEHPRYNIVTARISTAVADALREMYPGRSRSSIISEALADKIIRDRQGHYDTITRSRS